MAGSRRQSIRRKCIALACALAFAAPAGHAAEFEASVFFGDSLTDSGTFGSKFTTNPGPVWSELLGARLGTQAVPATLGGTNFAVGGARVTLLPGVPNTPPTDNALPITDQISAYLAATGGVARSRALYTVWGGANDVFVAIALGAGGPAYLTTTAGEAAAQVARLQTAGARFIIVPNVPDIGATPFGASLGPAGAAAVTQLSAGYNRDLYAAIAARGLRVIALDTFTLLREVMADPSAYGFVNTSVPACGATPSLLCTPADLVDPTAAQTFLFADGVHPTTAGHSVLGDYAASVLAAPGQISMLPETALQARAALVDRLYVQKDAQRSRNLWVTVDGQRNSIEAEGVASNAKGSGAGITVGVDLLRQPGSVLGAALGFARARPEFGNGGHYRQEETTLSLYGGWSGGPWQLNGALTYGALDYDVSREIRLGTATRTASGSPGGSNLSAGVEGGYRFSAGRLTHGPLASLLVQEIKVDAFSEQDAGSAALRYGEQKRSSAVGRLGWQLSYDAGWWSPYARLSLDRELRDQDREIEAQLVTAPELPSFSMPAAAPGRSFATLLAGASFRVAQGWSANLGISHTAAQSHAKATSVFATVAAEF